MFVYLTYILYYVNIYLNESKYFFDTFPIYNLYNNEFKLMLNYKKIVLIYMIITVI